MSDRTPTGDQPDPLADRCRACLAPPGEPCIGTTSDLLRERVHRLRPLAATPRLVHCPDCEGSGWRDTGRECAPTATTCPVCGADPGAFCTEGGHPRDRVHEVRVRAAHAGLQPCPSCDAVGWVREPEPSGDLRERLTQALYEWAVGHTAGGARFLAGGTDEHLRENSLARADAVLPVVEAETAALRAHDAECKRVWDEYPRLIERLREAERRRADALAAVQRVREEHSRDDSSPHGPWCNVCLTPWPCRTYRSTEALSVDTPEKLQALRDRLASELDKPEETPQ